MELDLVIQIAISTGLITVVSGAVILYIRKWYLYWRQVFLISAMEKQRSGMDDERSRGESQWMVDSGAGLLLTVFVIWPALVVLTYQRILNMAAIVFAFVYSLGLKALGT